MINPHTGDWIKSKFLCSFIQKPKILGEYTVGGLADSFYEYLLKCWLISDGNATHFRQYYDESAHAIKKHLIKLSANGDLYLTTGSTSYKGSDMEHLTCFAGGMFALGAMSKKEDNWEEMLAIGANLTETCYKMYRKQGIILDIVSNCY